MSTSLLAMYLTTAQVAELLGVRDRTVRRYIERGLLPAQKMSGFWLVPQAALAGFRRPLPGNPEWRRRKALRAQELGP